MSGIKRIVQAEKKGLEVVTNDELKEKSTPKKKKS